VFGHAYNWLILVGISLAGALIRVYFVARHKGSASPLPAVAAILLLGAIAWTIAPRPVASNPGDVSFAQVRNIINARCTSCHSAAPVHPSFPAAPLGIMFDSDEQIIADAERIHQQTVVTRVMPIGNLTAMTDKERLLIDAWFQAIRGNR
jgi:uncharacterized membrane protein